MEPAAVSTPGWTALPRGEFSGIDWGPDGATDGYDPYLVWAEASRFAGYGPHGEEPQWIPVLVELAPGCTIEDFARPEYRAWLRVPAVYTQLACARALRFCTAWIARPFFPATRDPDGPLYGKVKRFELGLPVGRHVEPPEDGPGPGDGERLRGHVMGLIDGGLAFANQAFLLPAVGLASGARAAWHARTRYLWRQDRQGVGHRPLDLGYGHELRGADIEAAVSANTFGGLVDEAAIYRHFELPDLRLAANHGTHVTDLACGPLDVLARIANLPPGYSAPASWQPTGDAASRCDLVAVQLDWSNVIDTSGGSMNVSIMDALMYILSRCADDARVVVNISWGTLAGPHNGSSVLEAAMDALVGLCGGRLQIVLPAGNGYQDRLHANATLAPGETLRLHWRQQPDDATQSFLELWVPPDATGLRISVQPPGGHPPLHDLQIGESRCWTGPDGQALAGVVFPATVATGTDATCALLALAPTFSFASGMGTAPCGTWVVEVTNQAALPATVDAYVERDDVALGQNTGARQSHLEDAKYDTSGNPASFFDRPVPVGQQLEATLIRRSGTFNSLATGRQTISVGGRRIVGEGWSQWSLYSPRRDDPDASRPQREGVVRVPSRMAWGDQDPVLLGLLASGTFSGSTVRLVGTSGSAPLEARRLFNALATSAPAASS